MLACLAVFPTEKALFFHEWKGAARQSVEAFVLAYTAQEATMTLFASLILSIVMVCELMNAVYCRRAPRLTYQNLAQVGINLQQTPRIFVEFWFASYALISVGESIGVI